MIGSTTMASMVNGGALRAPRRLAQRVDVVGQQAAAPVLEVDGEEPASAGDEGPAIIRHGDTIARHRTSQPSTRWWRGVGRNKRSALRHCRRRAGRRNALRCASPPLSR